MPLVPQRTFTDVAVCESTTAIGSTPVAAYGTAPVAGYVQRVMAASVGSTGATVTVAITINGGSDIAAGALTLASGAAAKNIVEFPLAGASAVFVNEGDLIAFTPSGGSSAVAGAMALVIRTG